METPKQANSEDYPLKDRVDEEMARQAEKTRQDFEEWIAKVPSMTTESIEGQLDYISTGWGTLYATHANILREELKKRGIKFE